MRLGVIRDSITDHLFPGRSARWANPDHLHQNDSILKNIPVDGLLGHYALQEITREGRIVSGLSGSQSKPSS
jgi:hypothetical protein